MKNITTILLLVAGIALPVSAQETETSKELGISSVQINKFFNVPKTDDTLNLNDIYGDPISGGFIYYNHEINDNNEWGLSYLTVSSEGRYHDTGYYWDEEAEYPAIYEGTLQIETSSIAYKHYMPLNNENSVKLYLNPGLYHLATNYTLEYVNYPVPAQAKDETKAYSTNLDVGIGLYFNPVEALEIQTGITHVNNIANDDETLKDKGSIGTVDIGVEYTSQLQHKVYLGLSYDAENRNATDKSDDYSYTTIGAEIAFTKKVALAVEHTTYQNQDTTDSLVGIIAKF